MEKKSHVLNEQLRRIEPAAKKCSFCSNGIVSDVDDCYYVPVYKVKDRSGIIIYSSVTYSKLGLGIPRCSSCKHTHVSAQKKAFIISTAAAIIILAYAVYSFLEIPAAVSIFLFLLSGAVGFGGYIYLEDKFAKDAGCLPKHRGPEFDPLIKEFRTNGWILAKPSA